MNLLEPIDGPECPRCGCRDGRTVSIQNSLTGKTQTRHIECNHCGQLHFQTGYTDGRKRGAAVRWTPHAPCPYCRGTDTKITGTAEPVRYHRCGSCRGTFHSNSTR